MTYLYLYIAIGIAYLPVGLVVLAGIDYLMIKTNTRFQDLDGQSIPLVETNWPVFFWPLYLAIPVFLLFLGLIGCVICLFEWTQEFCERVPVLDFPKLISLIHRQDMPKPETF